MANPRNLVDVAPLVSEDSGNIKFTNSITLSGGTANGVLYLNSTKVATSGSSLTFDGTNLGLGTATPRYNTTGITSGITTFTVYNAANGGGGIELATGSTTTTAAAGRLAFTATQNTDGSRTIAWIDSLIQGSTASNQGGSLRFGVKPDNGTAGIAMVLDQKGNLGFVNTPTSGWESGATLQFSNETTYSKYGYTRGAYWDGSTYKYIGSLAPSQLQISSSGQFLFRQAVSGSADTTFSFGISALLDTTGNFGIGNATPGYKLDVNSSSDVASATRTTGTTNSASIVVSSGDGTTSAKYSYIRYINNATSTQEWRVGTYSTDNFTWRNNTTGNNLMMLDTSGNLGLYTATPNSKLDVRNGFITSGTSASSDGTKILGGYYSAGYLACWGSEYSSGGPIMAYGLWPSTAATDAFVSSTTGALSRGAYTIAGNIHKWFIGAAQTVAIDSSATTNEVMRITPASNLHVGSYSNTNYKVLIYQNASGSGGGALAVRQDGTDPLMRLLTSGGGEVVHVTSGGNVGIGIGVVPTLPFHVKAGNEIQGIFVGSGAGYVQGSIVLSSGTDNTPSYRGQGVFLFNSGNSANWYMGTNYTDSDKFTINRKGSTTTYDSGTAQTTYSFLTITNTGQTGIGTPTPGAKLNVHLSRTSSTSGTVLLLSDNVTGSQTNGVYKSIRSESNAGSSVSEIRFIETDGTNNNTAIGFATSAVANALTERMRIWNGNLVSIGTIGSAPTSLLDLYSSSNLGATNNGIRVNRTGSYGQYGYFEYSVGSDATIIGSYYSGGTSANYGTFLFKQHNSSGSRDAMYINTSGLVGINNIAPKYALDVYGSGITASFGSNIGTSNWAGIHFGYLETANSLYRKSVLAFERTDNNNQGGNASGKIHFLLNNYGSSTATLTDAIFTIDSDANGTVGSARVGIRNSSPEYLLDLSPYNVETNTAKIRFSVYNGPAGGTSGYGGTSGGGTTQGPGIIWKCNYVGYTKQSAGILQIAEGNYFRAGLAFYTNNTTDSSTDWSEAMRISSNGNVGIGTASPNRKLHVQYAGAALQLYDASNNSGTGLFLAGSSSNKNWFIGNQYNVNDALEFTPSSSAGTTVVGSTPALVILSGGYVGIGTTTPGSYKLYVSGDQYISGTLTEASSIALKENINPINRALDYVLQLTGVTYDRKDGSAKNRAGLVAEQVYNVLPNVVQKDETGNISGIQYTNLIAYLVESIKELKAEIDTLRAQ